MIRDYWRFSKRQTKCLNRAVSTKGDEKSKRGLVDSLVGMYVHFAKWCSEFSFFSRIVQNCQVSKAVFSANSPSIFLEYWGNEMETPSLNSKLSLEFSSTQSPKSPNVRIERRYSPTHQGHHTYTPSQTHKKPKKERWNLLGMPNHIRMQARFQDHFKLFTVSDLWSHQPATSLLGFDI